MPRSDSDRYGPCAILWQLVTHCKILYFFLPNGLSVDLSNHTICIKLHYCYDYAFIIHLHIKVKIKIKITFSEKEEQKIPPQQRRGGEAIAIHISQWTS